MALVLAGAAAGIWFGSARSSSVRLVSLSGGVLVGLSLFWIFPEVGSRYGWGAGAAMVSAGAGLVWLIDRYVYPVCPTCAHSHDHEACATRLHGFAGPLVAAVAIHSLVDGFGIAVGHDPHSGELGRAVFWALALHKVPEGLALGVMLRASMRTWQRALAACLAAQSPMLAGGLLQSIFAPFMSGIGLAMLAGLAAGSFLYLGVHAVHTEWKQRRAAPAFAAALAGAALAALLERLMAGLRL
ncbi:MAG: ZIP family metal transporter [Bryobacteraceae bacterium]|nr:ZIP family metal transporter [Bryobacteraceae bacterium]